MQSGIEGVVRAPYGRRRRGFAGSARLGEDLTRGFVEVYLALPVRIQGTCFLPQDSLFHPRRRPHTPPILTVCSSQFAGIGTIVLICIRYCWYLKSLELLSTLWIPSCRRCVRSRSSQACSSIPSAHPRLAVCVCAVLPQTPTANNAIQRILSL